jgi:hypothetical protein
MCFWWQAEKLQTFVTGFEYLKNVVLSHMERGGCSLDVCSRCSQLPGRFVTVAFA